MLEKLTQESIHVIELAQEEATSDGYNFVGTDYILLGLLKEETSRAYAALTKAGLTYQEVRRRLTEVNGRGGAVAVNNPEVSNFTPLVTLVLDEAVTEAEALGQPVTPELILANIIKSGVGVGFNLLRDREKLLDACYADAT